MTKKQFLGMVLMMVGMPPALVCMVTTLQIIHAPATRDPELYPVAIVSGLLTVLAFGFGIRMADSKTTKETCPFCGAKNVHIVADYSGGISLTSVRMDHDRECKSCYTVWTPASSRAGAWSCVIVGSLLVLGCLIFAFVSIAPDFERFLRGTQQERKLEFEKLDFVWTVAGLTGLPGLGFLILGLRAMSAGTAREIEVLGRNEPVGSEENQSASASEANEVFFQETFSNSEIGKPVGLTGTGVIVYKFPGREGDVAIIPFSELDEITVTKETRFRRFVTNTGLLLGSLALGVFGTVVGIAVLNGRATGTSAFVLGVGGPLCLLMSLWLPVRYFTRLGYCLTISVGKKRGHYYFSPKDWDNKKELVRNCLTKSGRIIKFPAS